jgi:GNAT superfamily N-acetyltransferase
MRLAHGGPGAQVRELLDHHFDGTPGLCEEFPLLLCPDNAQRSWVFEIEPGPGPARAVAHAAWRPLELICADERIRAAGIGLVTTHGDWRGHGLASALVAHCTAQAYREGHVLALLFAPERSLYAQLGYRPAGRERRIDVPLPLAPALGAGELVRRAGAHDIPGLLPLLARHPWRVERSEPEFRALLAIPDTGAYLLERGGTAVAYCCVGKGRDLQGIVHEWAGEPEALAALLAEVASRTPVQGLLSPAAAEPPLRGPSEVAPLCLARVLQPEVVGTPDPAVLLGAGERPGRLEMYVWGLDSF